MTYTHLQLSPDFANELSKKGLLEPLIWAYKEFLEKRNYPLNLKDKNIAWLSVFGDICNYYSDCPTTEKMDMGGIIELTDKIINSRYPEERKVAKEFGEELEKEIEEKKEKEEVVLIKEEEKTI